MQNAAPIGAAFRSCIVTGLPNLAAGGYPPHLLQVVRLVYPILGPLCGRWLLPGPAVLGLPIYGSRYITGTLLIAIGGPFTLTFIFNCLNCYAASSFLHSGRYKRRKFKKP